MCYGFYPSCSYTYPISKIHDIDDLSSHHGISMYCLHVHMSVTQKSRIIYHVKSQPCIILSQIMKFHINVMSPCHICHVYPLPYLQLITYALVIKCHVSYAKMLCNNITVYVLCNSMVLCFYVNVMYIGNHAFMTYSTITVKLQCHMCLSKKSRVGLEKVGLILKR